MPIPLDDPRWATLRHAYGPATDVPAMIRTLALGEKDEEACWEPIWSALCHQGGVYTASFAALPHIVAIGVGRARPLQTMFWVFAADVVRAREDQKVPADLAADFERALGDAQAHAVACVADGVDETDATSLLYAIAALRGRWAVARALEGVGDEELTPTCPACERELFVSLEEVPFVAEDEDPVGKKPSRRSKVRTRAPRPELAALAQMARDASLEDLATKLEALDGDVTCPSCDHSFALLDAIGG